MDTQPKMNKNDDTLGVAFTNDHPNIPAPKGLLGNTAQITKANQSHLSDHGQVFDVGRAFSRGNIDTGTIVSDKKHTRPTLGENIQSAFSEWWGKTSKTVSQLKKEPEKTPEPRVVPKAETRATVVKEALSHTTIAPRDDHHIVVEKFRTYKQDVAKITGTPVAIKPPTTTKASWTHTVDEVPSSPQKPVVQNTTPSRPLNPDLRGAMVAPIVNEKMRQRIGSFTPPQPVQKSISYMPRELEKSSSKAVSENQIHVAPQIHKEARAVHKAVEPPVARAVPPPIPYVPKLVKQEEVPASPEPIVLPQTPTPPPPTPIPQEFHSTTQTPKEVTPRIEGDSVPKEKTIQTPVEHSNAFKTFIMKWMIVVLIVLLGVALAVIASFYFNIWKNDSEITPQAVTVPAFFETNTTMPLLFETSKQVFLETLQLRVTTATADIVHIYPTLPAGLNQRPATSEEILGLLSVNLPGKTLRALEDTIMFGSVKTNLNEPFMILRSYNFDVLFAGLLEWEGMIQSDLSPLFGTPSGLTRFTDAVRENKSIRILYDDTGRELLLYSFIDKNTVVITTSGEALARLIAQF